MENESALTTAHQGIVVPSNSGRNTLSRQWELLQLLPTSGSGATARALQERLAEAGFPTTKRTVERDLEDLSTVFAIRKNDKSVPFGFSWAPPSSFQASAVSVLDALTLTLTQEMLKPLIPSFMLGALAPRFEQARTKLNALAGQSPASSWPQKVASVPARLALVAPKINPAYLVRVQQALIDEQQLTCSYYSAHRDHRSQLVLNPLGLVQRGEITYLVATAAPYEDVRQFALHRMSEVVLTATPLKVSQPFDLKAYVSSGAMQFGDNAGELITLEAWVNEGLLRLLRETPLSEDMETMTSEDGGWIRAKVADSWELEWWLLSHTGSIAVAAPETLKQRLLQRLTRGLELYDEQ
jgi:predicted DNA-binding transcriptional regulator YafY